MSSLDAALFALVPPGGLLALLMCFSLALRSVVADVSPCFRPSAWAAACFYLSSSVGMPLLSRISYVIFIMSRFFRLWQLLMQNVK